MPTEGVIQVFCSCGKKLKAPATAAGRRARCPACGATVVLPGGETALVAVAAPDFGLQPAVQPLPMPTTDPMDDDDDFGAMGDLARQANSAAPPAPTVQCPKCGSAMEPGAVLCTECGYNSRTGKALSIAAAPKPNKSPAKATGNKKGKQPIDLMAPTGSFLLGVAMCAGFALAASVVWIVVAWLTGYAIGYIAILIGGAAGAGMKIGQKGFSRGGGFVAAGMTVAAILFAKLAVVEILLTQQGGGISLFDLDTAKLGLYLFSPFSLLFMVIGMGAAFRTANGSVSG